METRLEPPGPCEIISMGRLSLNLTLMTVRQRLILFYSLDVLAHFRIKQLADFPTYNTVHRFYGTPTKRQVSKH